MTLNCKPGDIARVFRVTPGWEWAMDRIVRVTTPTPSRFGGEWGWVLAEPVLAPDGSGAYRYAMDNCLKPIRDPGDDAVDESLSWEEWLPPLPVHIG